MVVLLLAGNTMVHLLADLAITQIVQQAQIVVGNTMVHLLADLAISQSVQQAQIVAGNTMVHLLAGTKVVIRAQLVRQFLIQMGQPTLIRQRQK
jgi:hypothetical protein